MEILAARIKRQLLLDTGKWGRCAIYENELQRIWPLNEENRQTKIEQFARKYGFRLSFYKPGLCAIFEKERPRSQLRCGRLGVSRSLSGQTDAQQPQDFESTVARLEATEQQQRKQIEALTDALQKVSAQLEINKPAQHGSRHEMKLETS